MLHACMACGSRLPARCRRNAPAHSLLVRWCPCAGVADQLAVNLGCELLKIVPGRVSTEVDAHLSYSTQASAPGGWSCLLAAQGLALAHRQAQCTSARGLSRFTPSLPACQAIICPRVPRYMCVCWCARARARVGGPAVPMLARTRAHLLGHAALQATYDKAVHLMDLYAAKGTDPSRVYIKIASTWEGIEACRRLERQGINCNLTLLFSFAQVRTRPGGPCPSQTGPLHIRHRAT
jgi:hypothetical protein